MRTPKRTVSVLRYLIALALMLVPALASIQVAVAQDTGLIDDQTYVSVLSGEETTWSGSWGINEDAFIAESDVESFGLLGDFGLFYVTYFDSADDIEVLLASYVEGFTSSLGDLDNVDAEAVGDGFYSLDLVENTDAAYVVFSTITEFDDFIRIELAVTSPDVVDNHVDDIKASIEFDSAEAFEKINAVTDSSVEVASQPDEDDEPIEDEDVTPKPNEDEPIEDVENIDYSDATEYTFGLNDAVVEWQAPWEFEPTLNYVEEDYESVGFVSGTSFQSIIYLPTGVDLDAARDAFLEGFATDDVEIQVLDRGSYENAASDVSYSLDLADIDGTLFGLFTVYIDDGDNVLAYATLALDDDLGESLDLAKETITINGEAVYNGVSGGGLQDLIDANSASFTPTDTVKPDEDNDNTGNPTPESDDDVDPDASEYLNSVRESYDELDASVARFDGLFGSGELSDAEVDELIGILEFWGAAALNAETLDVPDGYEDVQEAYLDYTLALQEASFNFLAFISAEVESAEQAEFFDAFAVSRGEADEFSVILDDLLSDAGV